MLSFAVDELAGGAVAHQRAGVREEPTTDRRIPGPEARCHARRRHSRGEPGLIPAIVRRLKPMAASMAAAALPVVRRGGNHADRGGTSPDHVRVDHAHSYKGSVRFSTKWRRYLFDERSMALRVIRSTDRPNNSPSSC